MSSDDALTSVAQTLCNVTKTSAGRPKPRLQMIGVLSPVQGLVSDPITIQNEAVLIGRAPEADASYAVAVIRDASVSRAHARITKQDDGFLLEDLGSSNGTYVDGVPIVSCVLRDGDDVQIGRNRFYFGCPSLLSDNDDTAAL